MKKILTSKAGVTILEGVIALGLLALVAGGAFGVLLSASRQNTQPDIREEMAWAVEQAHDKLKAYIGVEDVGESAALPENLREGLCGGDSAPLAATNEPHNISCLLPPICDASSSSFTYDVENSFIVPSDKAEGTLDRFLRSHEITFSIQCNGYKL